MDSMMRDQRDDPRHVPSYGLAEAAHYIQMRASTLRTWTKGRIYPVAGGNREFRPLIDPPSRTRTTLSFVNLVEAFVLNSLRRRESISVPKVRKALDYVRKSLGVAHPLADARFLTDGVELFVEQFGILISASESGQVAMRELLDAYLRRVEHDEHGGAVRLFPLIRGQEPDEPKIIVIDPFVSFGRPCVIGTGVPTATIAERYKAGESIDELSEDYGCDRLKMEEAIRCELAA